MEMIKVTIDNKQVEVEKGTSILHAAKKLAYKSQHFAI